MDELAHLQKWYFSQCNGDWENGAGVRICTLDNPGWSIDIDLSDTDLEGKSFNITEKGVGKESVEGDRDWYSCKVDNNIFIGRCGPLNLATVLRIFLDWANG